MAVVIAVVCAVVALVLLMVLLQTRAALSSRDEALTEASDATAAERRRADDLADEKAELEAAQGESAEAIVALEADIAELEAARDTDTERIDELTAEVDRLTTSVEDAERARAAVDGELDAANADLAAAEAKIEEQKTAAGEHERTALALTHENEALQEQLVVAADEAARRSTPAVPAVLVSDDGADLDVPAFSPATAWQLELVRSERTWRYSVAANPIDDPDPFATSTNPLRLAIEVEALALREDVGAFIGIDWQAGDDIDPAADPARAHLTLRLAQELLAAAAREMSPSTLVVASDPARGGVSLEVVASDPDDVDFKIPPPPIASEWIGIDEHGGMVVTVRAEPEAN